MKTGSFLRRSSPVVLLLVAASVVLAAAGWEGGFAHSAASTASPAAAPEAVITDLSPTGIVRNDNHLFVAQSGFSLETCQLAPTSSTALLKRVNLNGGGAVDLLSGCALFVYGMAADNSYVYLRSGDGTISRIAESGGAPQTLVPDAANCCGLALDDTHLYWAQRVDGFNRIFRVPKAGGPVEQIVSVLIFDNAYYIRDLEVDDTHVFWVEGKTGITAIDQPGVGGVLKAPKAGGGVETLASIADGIENPLNLALDDTHVYWTESDTARARRVSKNGGAVTDYNPAQENLMAGSVAVHGDNVYWTDTNAGYAGRLRRTDKAGGSVVDMAVGILGPGSIIFTDEYVYWGQHGGVYRLPLAAGEVAVDFSIDAIEVTQAIQDMANSVPLVAEKYTVVRVYPRVDQFTGQTVKIRLRGFDSGGAELDWSPLNPVDPHPAAFTGGANPFLMEATGNFILPPHWREGEITFQAEINYDGAINEINTANNDLEVTVDFNEKKPLCVEMVSVKTDPQTAQSGDPGFLDIVDWLNNSYPIPRVLIDNGGTIKEGGGAYELPDDDPKILARMGWYGIWHTHNQWKKCGRSHFYGMVHPSEQSTGGRGYRPGWSAWGVMNTDAYSEAIANSSPWYAPDGGATLAHELGHNRGRKHVDCGGASGTDNDYPYNPCNMGSGFPGTDIGFNYLHKTVIGPWDAGDLMSYAHIIDKPVWPSDYTYKALFNDIPNSSLMAASTESLLAQADYAAPGSLPLAGHLLAAEDILLVSALVTPTLPSAAFEQVFSVPAGTIPESTLIDTAATTLASTSGAYTLRLVDSSGVLLSELQFDLPETDSPPGFETEMRSFTLAMPYAGQTDRILLLQGETEIASRTVSSSAPVVQVLEPNGGESYAGTLTVRWEASDADGDPLSYLVQYSPDEGATWRVAELETISTTLELDDVSHLPGTNGFKALVRVIANDGLRSGQDTSDRPFSLRPNPPQAGISDPSLDEIVGYGQRLTLIGSAFDAEDGMVADSGLSWWVDGQPVGTGSEVEVSGLTLGKHTVRLTATDSNNLSDTVEHAFFVQRQYCTANDHKLDLVFVIDNSTPMTPHAQNFCQALPSIMEDLRDLGLEVRYEVFDGAAAGQGKASACASDSVQARWGNGIDHPSDWGKAVAAVASGYPWQGGYTRLIVPVTNQGPEDGNPTADPGPDRDSLDRAIAAAKSAAAAVSPLPPPPADSLNFFTNLLLAEEIAAATGGEVVPWNDPNLNIAERIHDMQARLGCTPAVDAAFPAIVTVPQNVCLTGQHFWPGTRISLGELPAPGVSTNANGGLVCFDLPPGIEDGTHPLRLDRPGVLPDDGTASIDIRLNAGPTTLYLPRIQR